MGKAILVMDMPKNCFHCKLQDWVNCRVIKGCHTGDTRPDWCPLREVPEKQVHNAIDNEFQRGAKNGWNACVNKILGGAI